MTARGPLTLIEGTNPVSDRGSDGIPTRRPRTEEEAGDGDEVRYFVTHAERA